MNVEDQMVLLSKLAQTDLRLAELAGVLRQGPKELKLHDQQVAQSREGLETAERDLEQADEGRLTAEKELQTIKRRLEQSQANAKRVTTEAQMEASKIELASLEKKKAGWEEQIIKHMGRAEELKGLLPKLRDELTEAELALEQVQQDTPKLVEAAKQEGMALVQTRDEQLAQLDTVVRRMYTTSSARGGNPLTTVIDKICQTCHTRVPPQYLVETIQLRAIHSCPMCKKIVGKVIDTPDDE